jgi:hypothetical protein
MQTLESVVGTVVLLLVICSSVHANTPISACGTITEPGDYVLTSDLQLVATGTPADCLEVSASQVNLDLGGHTVYVFCPWAPFPDTFCGYASDDCAAAPVGINVLSGANYVTIRNGSVGDYTGCFETGVAVAADHAIVRNLKIMAGEGIALAGSYGKFSTITYTIADEAYHGRNGPVISAIGNQNTFYDVVSPFPVGSDFGGGDPAIVIKGNLNVINSVNVSNLGIDAYVIPISGNRNSIKNSTVYGEGGCGIEVTSNSAHNVVIGNTVTVTPNPEACFAMFDANADCGSNLWEDNTFTNASPASCIN